MLSLNTAQGYGLARDRRERTVVCLRARSDQPAGSTHDQPAGGTWADPRSGGRARGGDGLHRLFDLASHRADGVDRLARLRRDRVRDALGSPRPRASRRPPHRAEPRPASRDGQAHRRAVHEPGRPRRVGRRIRAGRRRDVRRAGARGLRHRVVGSARSGGERAGRVRPRSRCVLRGRPVECRRGDDPRQRRGREAVRRRVRARQRQSPALRLDARVGRRHGRDPRRDGRAHPELPRVLVRHVPRGALRGTGTRSASRAMVLDGAIDPAEPDAAGAIQQAVGFEHALDVFHVVSRQLEVRVRAPGRSRGRVR